MAMSGCSRSTRSACLAKNEQTRKTVVIKPDSYTEETDYPVLYLLHGYSDRYDRWVQRVPHINQISDTTRC